MRNAFSAWFALCVFLSLSLPVVANNENEIDVALAAFSGGSAIAIKTRVISDRITVFDDETRAHAVAALPVTIRDQQITQGKLWSRIAPIVGQVLQLHERTRHSQQPSLFLFANEFPTAQIWRGCILLVSTGLAEPLYDGELAGIFAHELSHAYFDDEMAAAQRTGNAQAMRIIELKCDGIAILSLKLLNYNPAFYLKGLQRILFINKQKNLSSGIFQSHPELVTRAQFAQRLIKTLE